MGKKDAMIRKKNLYKKRDNQKNKKRDYCQGKIEKDLVKKI